MAGTHCNIAFVCLFVAVFSAGCNGSDNGLASGLQGELASERAEACIRAGQSRDESVLPLLVERLEDTDADVRLFAIGALKKITDRDFGYRYYAPPSDRSEAVQRWRKWLRQRREKISGG
ncbi:MAG: HEAT repeat domain-containing protein [Phycisphaerae bacterium]|nr:HEAT repeat domain-containing protein [Phycisphaerae bacterium]